MNISNFQSVQAPTLPSGFIVRPAQLSDIPQTVITFNLAEDAQQTGEVWTEETLRSEWINPELKLAQNTQIVIAPNGDVAGYIEFWGVPAERMVIWGRVHPAYEGRGIGTYLNTWGVQKAYENLPNAQDGSRVVLHGFNKAAYLPTQQLFEQLGFQVVRYHYRMRIDLKEQPAPATLPEGFRWHTYEHPQDFERVVRASLQGFRDHWGFVQTAEAEYINDWRSEIDHDPLFEPSLWLVALDDNQDTIAGVCLCRREHYTLPESGFVSNLAVLREYRRRGLASSMLRQAFYMLYQAGKSSVTLSVDADSLTGAVKLYEDAGMYIYGKSAIYELEIRAGRNLMTHNIQ